MAYKQRWLIYFSVMDADGNGFVEPSDLAVVGKRVSEMFKPNPEDPDFFSRRFGDFLASFIKACDTNNDGKLSKEEYLQGIEKLFIGKAEPPIWWTTVAHDVFQIFDENKNGELSLEELSDGIKRMNPKETDENINKAYEWVKTLTPSGKYDAEAWNKAIFVWGTSPSPTPIANILFPFFGMADHQHL